MGENGTYCENLQIFCGKMGAMLHQNPKKTLFLGPGGCGGGCTEPHVRGKMGENGRKWGKMGMKTREMSTRLPCPGLTAIPMFAGLVLL